MSEPLSDAALALLREIVHTSTRQPDDPPNVMLGEPDGIEYDYDADPRCNELRLRNFITRVWRYSVFQDSDKWQFIIPTGSGRQYLLRLDANSPRGESLPAKKE